jgi:hypothetical protein
MQEVINVENNSKVTQPSHDHMGKPSRNKVTALIIIMSVVGVLLIAILVVLLTRGNTTDIARTSEPTKTAEPTSACIAATPSPTLMIDSNESALATPETLSTPTPILNEWELVTPVALSAITPGIIFNEEPVLSALKPKTSYIIVPESGFVAIKDTAAVGAWVGEDNDTVLFILNSDYTFEYYIDGEWGTGGKYNIGDLYATGTYTFNETTMRGSFVEYYFDFTVAGETLVADPNNVFRRCWGLN